MGRKHLVVVLPGIGGSVLARPGTQEPQVVWDASKSDVATAVVWPARLDTGQWPRLDPIGLIRSPTFLGFTIAHGYEGLLGMLAEFGTVDAGDPAAPVPDADVVAVPYDFRLGVEDAARHLDEVVSARLKGLSEAERAARVIVVGHSMGGLVAR